MDIKYRKLQPSKYGVTEKKKSELDALNNQVLDAENEVEQLQAIVDSLNDKSSKFTGYLNAAEANKAQALANKNSIEALVAQVDELKQESDVAFNEMVLADAQIKELATQIKIVIDELIYSAEVINRLGNLVTRKKALNPLISDDLVAMITQAGTDANNAVSLTMVALQSVFTAQATSLESEAASALEYTEAFKLYETLTGTNENGKQIPHLYKNCLYKLIEDAYDSAERKYEHLKKAEQEVLSQLSFMETKLSKAQNKLKSLQSGLAAANAAALAS